MNLRVTSTYSSTHLDAALATLEHFDRVAHDEFGAVFPPIHDGMLTDLRRVPSRRYWQQDDWASEKQRRAFHASDGFGGGDPHRRTNRLPAGWQVTTRQSGSEIAVKVENNQPGAPYVYGSLAKSNPGGFQARGHLRTGWPQAYKIVTFWLDALKQDFVEAMRARLLSITARRRAFTRTRR